MRIDADLLLSDRNYILARLKRDELRRVAPVLSGTVIDLGCGEGPYRRYLAGARRYVGVDLDGPDLSVRGDVMRLPIRSASADAALLTEVLEHVRDPLKVLREANRILRTGGYLYVSAPQSWPLHGEPHDYWRFTKYGLAHLAQLAGFEIVGTRRVGGLIALLCSRVIDFVACVAVEGPMRALHVSRGLSRAPAIATSPLSLAGYYLSRALDGPWKSDAIGWSMLLRKPPGRADPRHVHS